MQTVVIDAPIQSALILEPSTGFMQTTGNYSYAFDGQAKADFLKVYKANGLAIYRTCKELSISHHTINHHAKNDPAFARALEECRKEYIDELEAKSRNIALTNDKATLERIFQLRALSPDKYARDLKTNTAPNVQISLNGNITIGVKKKQETLDAEIVGELGAPIESSPQIHQHPTETPSTPYSSGELQAPRSDRDNPRA